VFERGNMKKSKIILIVATGIAILIAGVVFKQEFFLMIPLFVSLFVMSFQSEANRIGPLIGSINSIIYTVAYIYMGVYASAASAILFSFPVQLMTFFRWKKNAYKKTAIFRKMTTKMRVIWSVAFLVVWGIMAAVFMHLDYEYAILDSCTLLFGFVIPVLTMFAYIEYTYLWIIQCVLGVFLNIQMVANDYKETTYLIYGVYALWCVIGAFKSVHKFYKEQ
jgi:nicotinamide mononucleotide transporter PnuC